MLRYGSKLGKGGTGKNNSDRIRNLQYLSKSKGILACFTLSVDFVIFVSDGMAVPVSEEDGDAVQRCVLIICLKYMYRYVYLGKCSMCTTESQMQVY